ncbi:type IV secretion system protein [Bartonella rattimassiliensis]|uniref:P-type DNA transfer protein VirB5 n=1 Tax=Bartonella rattimassiliensis 15908 TaxID=1094556 RepID=J0ZHT3_9HYPH|nr:type IV secretion system protein [Bartonella rattimassiliensis]EJF87733.1 hypothetical protein MCY_00187 [Bartonella rattimassiliensis 15908]
MKKLVISIAVAITLGASKQTMAWGFWGAGAADLAASVPSFWDSSSNIQPPTKTIQQQKKAQPITPLLDVLKQQLEQTQKIRESITGGPKLDEKKFKTTPKDNTSFFLKNPESIYNKASDLNIAKSIANIMKAENTLTSLRESRNAIARRIQYATAFDKAISLKAFQEANHRFQQIEKLLDGISTTKDLKSVGELQAHIIGMLAMLQNETTKLQMVSYSRNTEQALINQQKQRRNAKILNSKNKAMPTVKFIR